MSKIQVGGHYPQSFYEDIRDFHTKFMLQYDGAPQELDTEMSLFRIGFMVEELAEYAISSGYTSIAKILNELHQQIKDDSRWVTKRNDGGRSPEKQLDSLVDLVYVALGTSHLQGFDFDEAWRRVHQANMKKVRVPSNLEGSTRGSRFDVIKPRGWTPPDLSDLVWDDA